MSQKNKGSVLVTTLMFFSIIMTICISCLSITSSNNRYSKLQYEHIRNEELALSGIEITKSNVLTAVKYAIENFDEEIEFKNYFLGNTREIIGSVYDSGLYNVRVSLKGKAISDSDGNITFKIESVCKDGNYAKRIAASVKIINPWIKYGKNIDDEIENEDDYIYYYNTESNENIRNSIDTTKEQADKFDEGDLVVIYNYEEI